MRIHALTLAASALLLGAVDAYPRLLAKDKRCDVPMTVCIYICYIYV